MKRFAKTFAHYSDDLPDLNNLFGGRKNERGEALPWVLAKEAQAAAGIYCCAHRFIIRESAQEGREIDVQLLVIHQP